MSLIIPPIPSSARRGRDNLVMGLALAMLMGACRARMAATGDAVAPDAASADTVSADFAREGADSPDGPLDVSREQATPPDQAGADALLGYPPVGRQHLRGHFVFGNELHAFQSCGLPALTWVDLQGGEPGIDKLNGLGDPCRIDDAGIHQCEVKFIYVELDATVLGPCPGGPVGHVGKYQCSLRIDDLQVASATSPPDCPQTTPVYP